MDEYISKDDGYFKWHVEPEKLIKKSLFGNQVHILNVTSQKWMDESRYSGPDGAVWKHQVAIVIPSTLSDTKHAGVWIDSPCSTEKPSKFEENILVTDQVAHNTQAIAVTIRNIPVCPIVFTDDPDQIERVEESFMAIAWGNFLN